MRVVRSAGLVLLALVAAILLADASTMTSALAATALMVGGIGEPTLSNSIMSQALGGQFAGVDPSSGTPWQDVSVNWPAQAAPYWGTMSLSQSVTQGAANLLTAINSTSGPITVVGTSAGSLVVDKVMGELASDPNAPPPSQIKFVVIADGSQQLNDPAYANALSTPLGNMFATLSGYTYQQPPQTPYNLTVVTYKYDGFADFPDNPFDLVAVANAMAGILVLHDATYFVNLSTVPSQDITVTKNASGGTTTTYLVPPAQLPLITLDPALAPMASQLQQEVDAGYSRNNASSSSTSSTQTAATNVQASAATVDPPVSAAQTVQAAAQVQQPVANAITNALANAAAKTLGQADRGLTSAAGAGTNGATDLTTGNKATLSTDSANPARPGGSTVDPVLGAATSSVSNVGAKGLTPGNGTRDTAAGAAGSSHKTR